MPALHERVYRCDDSLDVKRRRDCAMISPAGATRRTDHVPTDELARGLHLLIERCVADDARRIADLAAGLVETRDGADDGALLHLGQFGDLRKGLSA